MQGFVVDEDDEGASPPSGTLVPRLLGDVRRLKQILINLIKNALKFTNSGFIDIEVTYKEKPSS